jgi:large conductance mechanosensitive channel
MLKEFRQFVLRGNVVDLAVGVVIGAAFATIVNSIVTGFIDPLVGFAGTGGLAKKTFCVGGVAGHKCPHLFNYGQVISAVISFVLIAAVIFFLVVKPVNSLMERFKADAPQETTTRECPECLSKIPKGARRCAFCTAVVQSPS